MGSAVVMGGANHRLANQIFSVTGLVRTPVFPGRAGLEHCYAGCATRFLPAVDHMNAGRG